MKQFTTFDNSEESRFASVDIAFSKQSAIFDAEDLNNPVLVDLRRQVYYHVSKYLQASSRILEINAGTGIDALYFVQHGHNVHATDIAAGMINQLREKVSKYHIGDRLTFQQLSYDQLHLLNGQKFNYVFSNSGGLNCIADLRDVVKNLPSILSPGAHATFVIMPPVCPWELLGILKGRVRPAFRRWTKGGVMAHLEGEYFRTHYHSLRDIRRAFGPHFSFVETEGLAAISPPPHQGNFPRRHPGLYRMLRWIDSFLSRRLPFNRWADHIIVTFRFNG